MSTAATTTSAASSLVPRTGTSLRQLVLACFVSDALSLGTHWVYDAAVIQKQVGRTDRFTRPTIMPYHQNKREGDFTHFGDSAVIVLESIAEHKRFDVNAYAQHWVKRWETLQAYRDKGTRETLQHLKEGAAVDAAGSDSDDDIGHGSKFFPLLLLGLSEDQLAQAARALAQVTQTQTRCHTSAEFLARVTHRVLYGGLKPSDAITAVAAHINDPWLSDVIEKARAAKSSSDEQAASTFGTACYVDHSLPLSVRFVLAYEDSPDPFQALVADTQIGGNSAARNFAIAAILYAYRGTDHASLRDLVAQLNHREYIESLITKLGQ